MLAKLERLIGEIGDLNSKLILLVGPSRSGKTQLLRQLSAKLNIEPLNVGWSVDCTLDHSLRGHEYRLWLKDHLAIYGVHNAVLAPGYRSPDQQRLEAESD